jgi:glycolate oxidase subunit GlcD
MSAAVRELAQLLGAGAVLSAEDRSARPYLTDATESRAIRGHLDAVALPADAEGVAATVRWCYEHDLAIVARGGGTGYAGGCVPDGGVVIGLERLGATPSIEPELWRAWVGAGVRTARLRDRARQEGLLYPPDPGSAEVSTIGGNIATNAGGPHTFKYGVTGRWVTGLEVVLAPGELVRIGGSARKDVAGYDLRALLVGSEGTLGIVTGAWLSLIPAPEAALPICALYATVSEGCAALRAALLSGIVPAALEFLDAGALEASLPTLSRAVPALSDQAPRAALMLVAEADGTAAAAAEGQVLLREAMQPGSLAIWAPSDRGQIASLWGWRDGVSLAVTARRGGKASEDVAVPVEQLEVILEATREIGARHGLPACSWGHAGDGNVHATFLLDPGRPEEVGRVEAAAQELFEIAVGLGGTVSGEHGVGIVKRGALALQWPARALELHESIKHAFDPKGLLNPGKKLAR